jgi:hypothetical protein
VIPWAPFERRWRDELCAAAIPAAPPDVLGYAAIDTAAFWDRFAATAAPTFQLGLRAAVWALTAAPLARRRPATFARLQDHEQDALLVAALDHRARLVRDLTGVLRLAACMAYFADPAVRARTGTGL